MEESDKKKRSGGRRGEGDAELCMQPASRLVVVTFRQRALVYTRRVHIDWERVDEVKLRAGRSDGLVFYFQSIPLHIACLQHRGKKELRNPPLVWGERVAFKIYCDRLTGLFKLMAVCPPSPPLSTSPCSLALVMALNLSLAFWRELRWPPV